MPTHTLGREYDLIDVGRADCHVHDQDHRQGRVRKVRGDFGKVRRADEKVRSAGGKVRRVGGKVRSAGGKVRRVGGKVRRGFRKSSGGTFSSIGYTDA